VERKGIFLGKVGVRPVERAWTTGPTLGTDSADVGPVARGIAPSWARGVTVVVDGHPGCPRL